MSQDTTSQWFQAFLTETVLRCDSSQQYNLEIDWATANLFLNHPDYKKQNCFIQTKSHDGHKLAHPILWSWSRWTDSVESHRAGKERQRLEQERSAVFAENHLRLIKALKRELDIHGDVVNAYAYRKLKSLTDVKALYYTEFLRVNLITKFEELP